MNKRFLIFIALPLILCIGAIGIFFSLKSLYSDQELQAARRGIESTVAGLPLPDGFVIIQRKFESFSIDPPKRISGPTCYYGRATLMIGTHTPARDALKMYVSALQKSGWRMDGRQYDQSVVLLRGSQEQANVFSREPALALREYMDAYNQAKKTQITILFVLLDYNTRNNTGC